MILGGQFVSRINMNLREDKGYTYGARTSFEFRRGPGPFVFQASVQSEVTADAVREALGELAGDPRRRPVTARSSSWAGRRSRAAIPAISRPPSSSAAAAAQLALYGLPDDYFTTFVPRVLSVDAADVTRVAHEHIDPAAVS